MKYDSQGNLLIDTNIVLPVLIQMRRELAYLEIYLTENRQGIMRRHSLLSHQDFESTQAYIRELDLRLKTQSISQQLVHSDLVNYGVHYSQAVDAFHSFIRFPVHKVSELDQPAGAVRRHLGRYLKAPETDNASYAEIDLLLPVFGKHPNRALSDRFIIRYWANRIYFFELTSNIRSYDGQVGQKDAMPSEQARHDLQHFVMIGLGQKTSQSLDDIRRGNEAPNQKIVDYFHFIDTDISDPQFRKLVTRVTFYAMHEEFNNPGFHPDRIIKKLSSIGIQQTLHQRLQDKVHGGFGSGLDGAYTQSPMVADAIGWVINTLSKLK